MTIRKKIFLGIFSSGMIVLLFILFMAWTQVYERRVKSMEIASDSLIQGFFELSLLTNDYLLQHEQRTLEQWSLKIKTLREQINGLQEFEHSSPSREFLGELVEIEGRFNLFADIQGRMDTAQDTERLELMSDRISTQISLMLHRLLRRTIEYEQNNQEYLEASYDRVNYLTMAVIAILLIVGGTVALLTGRHMTKNIALLRSGAGRIGKGQLDTRIELDTKDELADLATSFNAMAAKLQSSNVALKQEVEERRQAQADLARKVRELEMSNRDLAQFAYSASHDLQEPLRGIAGFAQLLVRKYKGQLTEEADEYIEFVMEGVTRMQDIVQGLLIYSRVGRMVEELKPVDSAKLVEKVRDNLSESIEENEAQIHGTDLPIVKGVETDLYHLFDHLIANALKYRGEEPPRITISAVRSDGMWEFSVTDNGIGLDEKYQDRIFRLYQRLHGRSEYKGTGIGLAICKKVVEGHGGKIWVKSKPGQGADFRFTLPAVEEEAEE